MSDLDENLAPEPVAGVDPQSLDANPSSEEYFVLSRLDGSITIGQLCKTSGLGPDKTIQCIENLHQYGLIDIPGVSAPSSPSTADEDSSAADVDESSSSSRNIDATCGDSSDDGTNKTTSEDDSLAASIRQRFPGDFSSFSFDPDLLEQQVELDDDFKRELLFVHEYIDAVDHYQLLGVDRDVERRGLRRAYFPLSKRYHPDRFYKKITGDFEPIIQQIFERITAAYQVLSDRNKRADYDDALDRGQAGHSTPVKGSTPASRRSETRENIKGDQKRNMAFKVLVQRGDQAMDNDRVSAALEEYRKALSLQPDFDLALRIGRQLLDEEVHLDDAITFARTAHRIDDADSDALKLIGAIYEKKGQLDDALYHYEMALESAPDDDIEHRISRLRTGASS